MPCHVARAATPALDTHTELRERGPAVSRAGFCRRACAAGRGGARSAPARFGPFHSCDIACGRCGPHSTFDSRSTTDWYTGNCTGGSVPTHTAYSLHPRDKRHRPGRGPSRTSSLSHSKSSQPALAGCDSGQRETMRPVVVCLHVPADKFHSIKNLRSRPPG